MNNFLFIFRKAGDDVGATSAGSIQMDLEIKSDLDKDIQAESSKIADRIRKQVDAMSGEAVSCS